MRPCTIHVFILHNFVNNRRPFYAFLWFSPDFCSCVELDALQARFIPTHYVHFDAHVDAVAHLSDTECGLEKLNQYYLVNFAQNK